MKRRLALLTAAGLAAAVAVLPHGRADGGDAARADAGAGPATVQPQLGPGFQATLIGATPAGTTGDPTEAWAFRQYPKNGAPPVVDGQPLPFADGTGRQLLLLRYTSAEGWRAVQTPADEQGNAYDGGIGSPQAARATPRGGLAMLVDDGRRPEGDRHLLLVADRGARLHVAAAPDDTVLLPQDGAAAAEELSSTVLAATDDGDHTVAYVGIEGRLRQSAVARWRDGVWAREPLCVQDADGNAPAGCAPGETLPTTSALSAVSVAADGDHAWLLARPADSSDRRLALFERTGGAAARWVLRDPGLPAGTDPLASSWALTATSAGVWIDGRLTAEDPARDLTAFYDGTRTTTWCDAGACTNPLGVTLSAAPGAHRSFAWAGEGFGARVIAPVAGGGERSDAYAVLEGSRFVVHQAYNADSPSNGLAAFAAPDEGWVGNSHITHGTVPVTQAPWPVPVQKPISAIASAPDGPPGAITTGALAVGQDGTVLRYTPGQGWDAESLLGASGVARDDLRGVAWPSAQFAFAVGDDGAMWRWDSSTGLWESDPGAPFDFQGHQLTGVAFQPGNPDRGYVVGRGGVLLRYDKSWVQDTLPAEVQTTGPLGGPDDLFGIAFAGSQALVAGGRHLLVNDGGGWAVDAGAQTLLDKYGARVYAVAGLADGGAVAAGSGGFVIERDAAGAPWHVADQPLPNQPISAVAAFREQGQVRALASVVFGDTNFPLPDPGQLPITDPGEPAPTLPPFDVPSTGTLMRQTANGWRDEDRSGLRSATADKARVSDPVLALLADASGRGWVVGGWDGLAPTLTDSGATTGGASAAATASVARYATTGPEPAPGQATAAVPTDPGPARLLVGGHAQCESACAGSDQLQLMPERTLSRAVAQAAAMAAQPHGPRALLYTGGRVAPGDGSVPESQAEADRLAALLGSGTSTPPVLGAVAPGDTGGGTSLAFQRAFAGAAAPFGAAPPAAGMTPVAIGAAPAAGLARTHYAVDISSDAGPVRVVVIDNAAGSLAAADPQQNPAEAQLPWLTRVLADARTARVPVVVMGNRSLDPADPGAADDAAAVATAVRDGGASAYVYDSPERSRSATIPAGANGIPAIGTGTLGYRSSTTRPGFDVPGLVMLEVDTSKRDATTNRAPVAIRLIPTLEDLVLEAVDGRVLNRSRPALFRGLGRRPRSGDRWSQRNVGSSPYVELPNPSCASFGCAGRIDPEVRFTSSNPDIADFVRQDPASDNPRKPFLDAKTDKVVPDATSGLLCAFNPGTTTVSVASGGLTYSTTVTVRGGSVLRPCGTTPLRTATAQAASTPSATPPPPPAAQPAAAQPSPAPAPAPLPVPAPPAPTPVPPAAVVPVKPAPPTVFTPPAATSPSVIATPPPPPGLSPRPIPPSGTSPVQSPTSVVQPATKVEKQREEEIAPEQQQSAVRYVGGQNHIAPPGAVLALLLAAGLAGAAGVRSRTGRRDRGEELALSYARPWRRRP